MAFPVRGCSLCGEEFELKPDKPGFANRCPACTESEPAAPFAKQGMDADERKTLKEAKETRRRAMRDLLYRKGWLAVWPGHATKLHQRPASLLRPVEHEKEDSHAEATERIDERREQHCRRNQIPQDIKEIEDERPHQESRHQDGSDESQQCSIFECHDRSMTLALSGRNSSSDIWAIASLKMRRR
jgi:hypothetical protein